MPATIEQGEVGRRLRRVAAQLDPEVLEDPGAGPGDIPSVRAQIEIESRLHGGSGSTTDRVRPLQQSHPAARPGQQGGRCQPGQAAANHRHVRRP